MNIIAITASKELIRFQLDAPISRRRLSVTLFSPALSEDAPLCSLSVTAEGDFFTVSRQVAGRDGAYLCYTVSDDTGDIDGVRYVSDMGVAIHQDAYPEADSKKGLQCVDIPHALHLGIRHAALTVNLGDVLMEIPDGGNTLYFRHDGQEYYIRRSVIRMLDEQIRALTEAGVIVYLILLNSPLWMTQVTGRFWGKIAHPTYDEEGEMALFDVMRESGCRYYRAFVAFLAQRYMGTDAACGRVVGLIVGNEVNSPWIWANAGDVPFGDYVAQYATALRLAWQTVSAVWSEGRVYVSLDHHWAGRLEENAPTRYYSGRDFLTALAHCCALEGDFPWHVAYHPYPENPANAAFWEDRSATHSADAYRVTLKNVEVLTDHMALPEMLYRGGRRHVIFSEVGFPSDPTPAGEALQAEALRRAWEIVQAAEGVDALIYYSHMDETEAGGTLGLCHEDGREKPACTVFRALN